MLYGDLKRKLSRHANEKKPPIVRKGKVPEKQEVLFFLGMRDDPAGARGCITGNTGGHFPRITSQALCRNHLRIVRGEAP